MLVRGKRIEKNRLRYYIGKQIYVEWKFEAFMRNEIVLCDVIDETSFKTENNQIHCINNNLIKAFYEVEHVEKFKVIKPEVKLYKYVVICDYEKEENNTIKKEKHSMKLFEFKEIKDENDLNSFKDYFIQSILKEDINILENSIYILSVNLLNYT